MSGLERGVDFFREDWAEFSYLVAGTTRESSKYLHEAFWKWRETTPQSRTGCTSRLSISTGRFPPPRGAVWRPLRQF